MDDSSTLHMLSRQSWFNSMVTKQKRHEGKKETSREGVDEGRNKRGWEESECNICMCEKARLDGIEHRKQNHNKSAYYDAMPLHFIPFLCSF